MNPVTIDTDRRASRDWPRTLAVIALYAVLGPIIGAASVVVVLSVGMMVAQRDGAMLAMAMIVPGMIIGLAVGFIPAAVTGTIMAALSPRQSRTWHWLLTSTAVGLVVSAIFARLFLSGMGNPMALACGTLAGLACAAITLRIRPRPVVRSRPRSPGSDAS